MNCPVCQRELAPTLSICLTCGAMMNDTAREEVAATIRKPSPVAASATVLEIPKVQEMPQPVAAPLMPVIEEIAPVLPPRVITAKLKKDTSPTLVGFQPKNPAVPDWRLELQNSIKKRSSNGATAKSETASPAATPQSAAIPRTEKVANALKRIEDSRKTFSAHGIAVAAARQKSNKPETPKRSYRYDVIERTETSPGFPTKPTVDAPRPKLVSPLRIEKKKFDTNKLPPIDEVVTPGRPVGDTEMPLLEPVARQEPQFERLTINNSTGRVEIVNQGEDGHDEIDDLAPLSMRFGAAVFDLIIGGFAAAILLSPFLISTVDLATVSGFLAIGGAVLMVMFLYQTATIAFLGRTFGMKLFSLEIIDAEENELPTLHQAAVNSSVYLLTLLFGGVGFLSIFFNEERRTLHDMLSGTLLIREY